MTDYEILKDICQRRKSHRFFADTPVQYELLDKIRDIALTSPYASGKRNWDIIIIDDQNRLVEIANEIKRYITDLSDKIKDDFRDGFLEYSKSFYFFENAPAAFILTYRVAPATSISLDMEKIAREDYDRIIRWELENAAKSISCPAMLVLLAAESLGLGACYTTGGLIAEERIIGLITNKKDRRVGAIIPVGYSK